MVSNRRRKHELLYENFNEVLTQLKASEHSVEFLEPVNWKKLDLDDYLDIVKNPMDLKTIRKKLKLQIYKSPEDFWFDIDLIWSNCQLYNHKKSNVYKQSVTMQNLSNNLKEAFFPELTQNNYKKSNTNNVEISHNSNNTSNYSIYQDNTDDQYLNKSEDIEDDNSNKNNRKSNNSISKSLNCDSEQTQRRVLLCQRISRLSPELLAIVVRYIYSHYPEIIYQAGEYKYVLDIELMDDKIFNWTNSLTKRLLKIQNSL